MNGTLCTYFLNLLSNLHKYDSANWPSLRVCGALKRYFQARIHFQHKHITILLSWLLWIFPEKNLSTYESLYRSSIRPAVRRSVSFLIFGIYTAPAQLQAIYRHPCHYCEWEWEHALPFKGDCRCQHWRRPLDPKPSSLAVRPNWLALMLLAMKTAHMHAHTTHTRHMHAYTYTHTHTHIHTHTHTNMHTQ